MKLFLYFTLLYFALPDFYVYLRPESGWKTYDICSQSFLWELGGGGGGGGGGRLGILGERVQRTGYIYVCTYLLTGK